MMGCQLGQYPRPVVGMELIGPELRVVQPLTRGEAQDAFELGAHVQEFAGPYQGTEVGDGRELFDQLSLYVAKQIYQGYGFDLGTHMARKALEPVTKLATGTIRLKLYKGRAEFDAATDVPHQLYSESNASMEAIGEFDHADSEGFLRVLQVSARALAANGQVVAPAWAAR